MIALAITFANIAAVATLTGGQHLGHETRYTKEVRQELIACRIPVRDVEAEYQDILQDYEVTISTNASILQDDQYACVFDFIRQTGRMVHFADEAAHSRFGTYSQGLNREAARQRLSEQGVLAQLPTYVPDDQQLAAYVQIIEELCGIEGGSSLIVDGAGTLTMQPLSVEQLPLSKISCLLDVLTVLDLGGLGFVGTEVEG